MGAWIWWNSESHVRGRRFGLGIRSAAEGEKQKQRARGFHGLKTTISTWAPWLDSSSFTKSLAAICRPE